MANEFAGEAGHSAEYFGDTRDYWWNDDYLSLSLRRWGVGGVRTLLDVGCGVGHWGRAWARVLPPQVEITGVDREPAWIEKAKERGLRAGLRSRCRYQYGLAEALPFADESFDFVTCQTLLLHVPDVDAVLAEMVRVTRPGGIVVAAEPDNAIVPVLEDALAVGLSVQEIAELVRFQLTCQIGRTALGLGDQTIGRILPGAFTQAGLEGVSVCVNEKTCPMVPPYTTPQQRAAVEEAAGWVERDFWIWSEAEAHRYFLAGGGQEHEFAANWRSGLELGQRVVEALTDQTYVAAGGRLFYLIAGKKPLQGDQG